MVLIYAIALLGLNILTGYNGQISLGTAPSTPSAPTSRRS
jgi:ABC-type branched-subunit amino acid transport system permease subunit